MSARNGTNYPVPFFSDKFHETKKWLKYLETNNQFSK